MIISHSKHFIFIHVYKVAGTSVKNALRPYADIMYRRVTLRRLLYVLGLTGPVPEHATARQLAAQLPDEVWKNYFKFAFVRNPWDWQVSLYHYIASHPFHPEHTIVKRLGSLRAYLEWRLDKGVELQKDFVTDDNGKLIVDFVGKYETLVEDFRHICNRLNIEVDLPHKNPSDHAAYQHYYDDYTKQLIEQAYREDIEMFNYHFENNSAEADRGNPVSAEISRLR